MVTTTAAYTDARYRSGTGQGQDGVVRIAAGGYVGTGILLYDGQAVLTAAHLVKGQTSASVLFETAAGSQTIASTRLLAHSGYDSSSNNDLAIVWLSRPAPLAADRYQLYRDTDEIGKTMTLVGYGVPGTGSSGTISNPGSDPLRLKASNRADADIGSVKDALGAQMGWQPLYGTQLVADFDDGSSSRDALGRLAYLPDLGLYLDEGFISPGDSGGPAFIDGLVAGVASYKATLSRGATQPDADNVSNSSFGEIAAWQRVSAFQQWIDEAMRQAWTDAPKTPADVKASVTEGHSGTSYTWFLVQYHGTRTHPTLPVSVDYKTRDGTAKAGSDYVGTSGTLNIYPGESQAVIPIEIIGDTVPEASEFFYLDVFNPVGGSFGQGLVILTGVRTILDNDAA